MRPASKPGFLLVARRECHWLFHDRVALLLILGVPLYWIGTVLRIVEEEKLLRAQFGEAYDAYAARVKRFLPGII